MNHSSRYALALLVGLAMLVTACFSPDTAGRGPGAVSGQSSPPNVVILWNEAMLAAIRHGAPRPTVTARSLLMTHQAIYDAWSLYDRVAVPTVLQPALRRPSREWTDSNKAAAVSQAAYQMLMALFPRYEAQTRAFSRLLHQQGYIPASTADPTTAAGIGYAAAQAVLAARANDGSNAVNNFADIPSAVYPELYQAVNSADPAAPNAVGQPGFDPNRWQPLRVPTGKVKDSQGQPLINDNPMSYADQIFLTPHWGAVTPFALTSGAQFRPPAPPQAGSDEPYVDGLGQRMTHDEAYHQQVDEILAISAHLTDEQKSIAEYWADGPRSETPPGHWNALAHGISARDRHTLDEDVKIYFALNGALFDASIVAWDAKSAYDYIRPISAIRHRYVDKLIQAWGGPNQGTQCIRGETWRPYQDLAFVTPAFSEYVSGHSTFSAAAATVLTAFTGSARFYDGKTTLYNEDFNGDGVPDLLGQHNVGVGANAFEASPSQVVVLQWPTFQAAADEAGMSRRYGGIHFQDGDLRGREMGHAVGQQAYRLAERYWKGDPH